MTTVVNIKTHEYDVYIGRPGKGLDGYFGNPLRLKPGENRGETIEKYRKRFLKRIEEDAEFKRRVLELRGKRLGCFCKPFPCHGDVIKEWLDAQPVGVHPLVLAHQKQIMAVTGHRPDKLGGYKADVFDRLRRTAEQSIDVMNPSVVITGMALGWDTAMAQAACLKGVPFHAYVPFEGQEEIWSEEAQAIYHDLLQRAEEVVYVCEPGFASWKMHKRNEAMVDAADYVGALYNGTSGGTARCIAYARTVKKHVLNAWDRFNRA